MEDMMRKVQVGVLAVSMSMALLAGAAAAESNLWLHVKVDEGEGAKVTVNLPVSILEKAMPMIPAHELDHARIGVEDADVELEDLRALWEEIKSSPDMTFVTVEDAGEHVRVWKEKQWVYVEVRDDDGGEAVDVKIPEGVVDALLAGEEIDVEAAVRALVDQGAGEFVTVRDENDTVRVWVDDIPEAD
jgi:hypothetical protein